MVTEDRGILGWLWMARRLQVSRMEVMLRDSQVAQELR